MPINFLSLPIFTVIINASCAKGGVFFFFFFFFSPPIKPYKTKTQEIVYKIKFK